VDQHQGDFTMKKFISLVLLFNLVFMLTMQEILTARPQKKQKYTLAVLNFGVEDSDLTEADSRLITLRFSEELGKVNIFYTLPQEAVEKVLLDHQIDLFNCAAIECGVQASGVLGTQLIVVGNIKQTEGAYVVKAQMVHTHSREIVQTLSEDFQGDAEGLIDFMSVFARKFVGLPVAPPQAGPEAVENDVPPQPLSKPGGFNWKYLGLGLLIAGGVSTGVYFLQRGSDNRTPVETSLAPLDGPPSFP
ncbi:MAG: hypothetical protein ACE5HO_15835, partial [bacterium]